MANGMGPGATRDPEEKTPMHCVECGHDFKKKITPCTVEVKCPRCRSYDTEPSEYFTNPHTGR